MRDQLAHRYFDTTHAIATSTVTQDLPRLRGDHAFAQHCRRGMIAGRENAPQHVTGRSPRRRCRTAVRSWGARAEGLAEPAQPCPRPRRGALSVGAARRPVHSPRSVRSLASSVGSRASAHSVTRCRPRSRTSQARASASSSSVGQPRELRACPRSQGDSQCTDRSARGDGREQALRALFRPMNGWRPVMTSLRSDAVAANLHACRCP
jgi:hypothetical protein